MTEPISSSNRNQSLSSDYDSTLDDAGQVCRADAPPQSPPPVATTAPSAAVTKLMSAAPPPVAVLPPTSNAQNNAQRTSDMTGIDRWHLAAGVTQGDAASAYVEGAIVKGRDPKTGTEMELGSLSVQVGAQNEAQFGAARLGLSGKHGSVGAEALTLRANLGVHNDDGSTGVNVGAGATMFGAEGTALYKDDSLTVGLSAGPTAAFSIGVRDRNDDGSYAVCVKVSAGPLTIGYCQED